MRTKWFEIYRDADKRQRTTRTKWARVTRGRWRWRLWSTNGQILGSGQGFTRKTSAIRSSKLVRGRNVWPILIKRPDGVFVPATWDRP